MQIRVLGCSGSIAAGSRTTAFLLDAAHERGSLVWGLVGRKRQAKRQIEAGVDAVIAQGFDAGGHTGDVGTLSIVAEVASIAGDTPVIAAGGITTGRHLAAALCLGASGVWTGTLWLACRESDVDMLIKERLVVARIDHHRPTVQRELERHRAECSPFNNDAEKKKRPACLRTRAPGCEVRR